MIKQSAADKKPVFISLQRQVTPVNDNFGAIRFALIDIANDTVFRVFGDHRPHLNTRLVKLANFQCPHFWRQLFNETICSVVADRQYRRHRHTAFASRPVSGAHRRINRLPHIGIRHDDHMIFRTA